MEPSFQWSDDPWFLDQKNRTFYKNSGYKLINKGHAEGKILDNRNNEKIKSYEKIF